MLTSKKIEALIAWGTKPYRISKETGISESTVRDIWNGKTDIGKVKLDTAEKLEWYYDRTERNLSEAIATVDLLIYKLDPKRQRLSNNYNLYQKIKREPFKVFEKLHKIAMDPEYSDKLQSVNHYFDEMTSRIDTIDINVAYNITLSDKYEYYMSCQRHKLSEQD